ncbi:MAG: hypothetical protein ACREAJ_00705 [Nitrosopumilaceae archaeon]
MKPSKSDLLRKDIYRGLDESYDFSNRYSRKQFWFDFCESNSDVFDKDKDRTLFVKILQDCLKKRRIDPASLGLKRRNYRFDIEYSSSLAPKLVKSLALPREPTKSSAQQIVLQKPIEDGFKQVEQDLFDKEAVGSFFQSLFLSFSAINPYFELLSVQEKNALADMWYAAFQRLGKTERELLIPAIGTLGIFSSKVIKARKERKAQEKETADKENNDKKDTADTSP